MKPRARTTYQILAVALTAAAGCTTAAGNEVGPRPETGANGPVAMGDTPKPPAAQQAQAEAAVAAARPAPEEAAASPAPSPEAVAALRRPARPMSDDPALAALRWELIKQDREQVLANPGRFRPLCDDDGYPLVGNLMQKLSPEPGYQPSAFCQDLRTLANR